MACRWPNGFRCPGCGDHGSYPLATRDLLQCRACRRQTSVTAGTVLDRTRLFHYTPTSASWLNAVEGFFAKLTRSRLQRGVFHSLVDLQAAINRYLAEHNQAPRPFVWTAEPEAILAKVKRGHQTLETNH